MGIIRKSPAVLMVLACASAAAAPGGIESVLISRTGDTADVEIRFACPNRLLNRSPATPGVRADLKLARVEPCAGSGDAVNDATRPPGRELAALAEVAYTAPGGPSAALALRFDREVVVTVSQSGDLRSLRVQVKVPPGSAPGAATDSVTALATAPAGRQGLSPEQVARAEERARLAGQAKAVPAPAAADFVLNLRSTTDPLTVGAEAAGIAQRGQVVYVADLEVDDQVWHRLRLGFFATEADANAAFLALRARFPDAWVTRASPAERLAAGQGATAAASGQVAATAAGQGAGVLTDAQAAELLAQARSAIVDQDYPRAIDLATRILGAAPRAETPEAREILGLARERKGEAAQAAAEYRRYLADYPEGDGAIRVEQRLAALTTAREQPRESIRGKGAVSADNGWEVYGGISQFYRLDSVDFGGEQGSVDQSALYSDAEVVARYSGERFDVGSRATLAYVYDMSSGDYNPGSQARFYNLYVDLDDRSLGISTRLGRQTLRDQGVLGRFDGALVSWQWAPSYRLNLVAGLPVYSPDQNIDSDRTFYGMSVDVLQLLDMFDVNVFFNIQDVDGVNDREAVGAEIRYFGENKSLVTLVDYDFGYSELNSIVAQGNWTFDNRMTVNGRIDWRNNPYLTTETALIGQEATSIQGLLLTYTEGEIRQLALDRSGAMQSFALGVARPISERFQISADVTASQYDATPASGGVKDTPDSGTLVYSYLSLIGTSLVREGDVSILGLRYSDGGPSKSYAAFLDTRYPLTSSLRLNPKLLVSRREYTTGDSTDWLVRPGLRVLYRVARHFQVDVEGGGEFGTHDTAGDSNNSTGYYLYMGYSADF